MGIKITTWNVNGIRAAIKKGLWSWALDYKPDILCLQEIKAREDQVPEAERLLDGYQAVWNPAERAGYSGVAIYTRIPADRILAGLGEEEFDREGRVLRMDMGDTSLFNVYFPNGQRGHERVEYKLRFYSRFLDLCNQLMNEGRNVIITGDFNTAHHELDLANPKENSQTSGFLKEEREWLDIYHANELVDAYRHLYPERVQYTWWTYLFKARERNIGWRIDHFYVSRNLLPRVESVEILDQVPGSDHCPVTLTIDLNPMPAPQ